MDVTHGWVALCLWLVSEAMCIYRQETNAVFDLVVTVVRYPTLC